VEDFVVAVEDIGVAEVAVMVMVAAGVVGDLLRVNVHYFNSMALYGLYCADVPLRNCSLTHP